MASMVDHWLKMIVFVLALLARMQVKADFFTSYTFLDSAVSKGAVCLDGSPPAYFHESGFGSGVDKWILFLEGGGWCHNETECIIRSQQWLGSSRLIGHEQSLGGLLTNSSTVNPDFYNWNRIFVKYCDGASFSGDVEEVDPVTNLHRRGARIFNAVVEHLLQERGMKDAKYAMLSGNSAGALATMLHCDNFRELVPDSAIVKCVADSGFFIRGKNLPAPELREGQFASMVSYHGMSKTLSAECTSKMDPSLCLFPENFVEYIKTPLFIVNSAFDQYQMDNMVQAIEPGWRNCTHTFQNITQICTFEQMQEMKDFQIAMHEALPKTVCPSSGMWITNCFIHDHVYIDGRWNHAMRVNNKLIHEAVGDWFFDRSCATDIQAGDVPIYCTKVW